MAMEVGPRLSENTSNSLSLPTVPGSRVQEKLTSVGRVEGEDHTVPERIRGSDALQVLQYRRYRVVSRSQHKLAGFEARIQAAGVDGGGEGRCEYIGGTSHDECTSLRRATYVVQSYYDGISGTRTSYYPNPISTCAVRRTEGGRYFRIIS